MEYLIILIISAILLVTLKFIFGVNIKQIKKLGDNKELDNLTNKFPDNIAIGKKYLHKLNNEKVQIEENKESKTSLYIAISNKIIIANLKNNFTRIQTIAHECLHSVQDRKILIFNNIFSNIYLLYFAIISVTAIFKKLPNKLMFLNIFIIFGLIYYVVRSYLENDAMIKARFLAKEYMEEEKILRQDEINKIIKEYDKINNMGIKCVNYNLLMGILIKIIIISLICCIR